MVEYDAFFQKKIQELRSEHRYRIFADLERFQNNPPFALWHPPIESEKTSLAPRKVAVWCTNDYLGLRFLATSLLILIYFEEEH